LKRKTAIYAHHFIPTASPPGVDKESNQLRALAGRTQDGCCVTVYAEGLVAQLRYDRHTSEMLAHGLFGDQPVEGAPGVLTKGRENRDDPRHRRWASRHPRVVAAV